MSLRVHVALRIASTWNGEPACPDEIVELMLARRRDGLALTVEAPWFGDPPPSAPVGRTDRLWEHEVVELFLAGPGAPHDIPYLEVELAPHGHFLVLRFRGVRRLVGSEPRLDFAVRHDGERWTGRAHLPEAWLPPRPWRANAFALHGAGASRRHLAASPLPGPAPDFHQPDRFPPLAL